MIWGCVVFLLAGCIEPGKKDKPVWEDVKLGDIGSPRVGDVRYGVQKTMNFDVYVFEIPAKNVSVLDNIWKTLYNRPLRFNDMGAFGANLFSVGFGQSRKWDRVGDMLRAAGGKKIKKVTLLLTDGQTDDLAVATLGEERTIFYVSSAGVMEGVTVGPGRVGLRMKAERIGSSRGVCRISFQPVFSSLGGKGVWPLDVRESGGDFLFESIGFELKMSPGDFIFLGPKEYVSHQITLGSLFFSKPGRKPVARTFLLLCTGIVD